MSQIVDIAQILSFIIITILHQSYQKYNNKFHLSNSTMHIMDTNFKRISTAFGKKA